LKWDSIQLGEVMDVKHGYAFKSQGFADTGDLVLLTPGNCHESGGLKLKGEKEKYYVGEFPPEFLLNEGDMLVVMTDLINTAPILGGSFVIPENNRFLHNQRLGLVQITDEMRIDKTFLYYLLNTHDYRAQVRGSASGATVRHTSPGRIRGCKVRVPRDVAYQHQVGATLSAYDDLIENNRRRMGLLEDAARQLYREWFVRLRFPGHEHTRITNGVPEGWERVPLGARITLNYGKALKAEDRTEGTCPVYGSSGIVGMHEKALVAAPGIVVGRKGNVGSVYWCPKDYWPIDTVYFIDAETSNLWLYYALQHMHFISTDVAVPGLNRAFAYSRPLLVPESRIVRDFLDAAGPLREQIARLDEMNEKLRAARDLLLPRLMSGEIAV
jgi:type I restriction enzyme S subunit